jgi:replication-associated recombination protein RarA
MNKYDNIIYLLKDNLIKLTKIEIQNNDVYQNIKHNKLLNEINELKNEKNYLKRKYDEYINEDKKITFKKISKYNLKVFKKNKDSYTNEQINKLFYNIKNINDIINLKDKWYYIRHNFKLQKLYNIIEPLEKLTELIGLQSIKNDIFKIIIYYVQNIHRDEYLHTVIYGPPGVGKTEFAKIYADIFIRLNILKTDNFIEIKRSDLVAEYLGQTSHLTKKTLENAIGGVLFLDEAYTLGSIDNRDSFSKEAIDTINQFLSEHKNELMFIIAGYDDDLEKCFFSQNKGLKRRFSTYFTIEKYSYIELMEIFKLKIKKNNYILNIENDQLKLFFKNHYNIFKYYAGDIEKFINFIKYEHNNRIFNSNIYNKIIILKDLDNSLHKINPYKLKEKYILSNMYI